MAQLAPREDATVQSQIVRNADKPVKILAKSLFRELRTAGYDDRQIVALSTELIGLLTTEIKDDIR